MKDDSDHRNILIALNVGMRANPDAEARLGAAVDEWSSLPSRRHRHSYLVPAARRLGVRPRTLLAALSLLPSANHVAEREIEACRRIGADIVTRIDDAYPADLLDLEHPPPVLYLRGHLTAGSAISIVGSRRSDPYGLEVAELFALELATHGLTIVSGLALGIDAAAHRGALRAGGRTIAVLGCGIDIDYPRANRRLAREIPGHGAILSEFPRGSRPEAWRFPVRNRIIAALALGTIVVRGTPRSGSLITAHRALDLGRRVYAVPGDIFDRRSLGPNCLIRDGAFPIQHPREILESLPCNARLDAPESPVSDEANSLGSRLRTVLELLQPGRPTAEDEIVRSSTLSAGDTLAALLELELAGRVRRHAGASFVLVPPR